MKLLNVDTIKQVADKLDEYFGEGRLNLSTENVCIRDSVGRYLAKDIFSDLDIPPFTRSVIDGYAVCAEDTFGISDSSPIFLDLIEPVEMGKDYTGILKAGQAAYIPTGGILPQGANAAVMVEHSELLDEKTVALYKPVAPNTNIINKGDDFVKNTCLFRRGHRVSPKDIIILATIGKSSLQVYTRPKIAVISTGDELVGIDETPRVGEIREANSYALAAFVEGDGGEIVSIAKVDDKKEHIRSSVKEALGKSDIVLISGGSSAGNKDMTADIIDSMGKPGVITHGIAMKPGKPTIIGIVENEAGGQPKLLIGLPGHPVATVMVYHAIVQAYIKKCRFCHDQDLQFIIARVTENVHSGEGRETFQLVSLHPSTKNPQDNQVDYMAQPIHAKSAAVSQLLTADGYIRIPALSEGIKKNDTVKVVLLI